MIALVLIACLLGLIQGYSVLWAKATTGKIKLTIRIESICLSDGDEGDLWMQLENTSWLPIPWLELVQPLPDDLLVLEAGEWRQAIHYTTYLLPRQRVERKFRLCFARGYHLFGKAEFRYGDGIGLRDNEESLESGNFLLVRPKMIEDAPLSFALKELVGEKLVVRWFQEDTSRLQGIRGYQPSDPYKNIHWQATAKLGAFMVKQYETTSETDFYILLSHQFYEPYWMGTNKDLINQTCRLTATLFYHAAEEGYSFGLVSNAGWPGMGGLTLPLSRGLLALDEMLDSLGSISYSSAGRFADVLEQMRGRWQNRSTLVVVTALWSDEIARELALLRAEGHSLILIVTKRLGVQLQGMSAGIPVFPLLEEDIVEKGEVEKELEGHEDQKESKHTKQVSKTTNKESGKKEQTNAEQEVLA